MSVFEKGSFLPEEEENPYAAQVRENPPQLFEPKIPAFNQYDQALLDASTNELQQLGQALQRGRQLDPEKEARVQQLRLYSKYPAALIRENLDDFERLHQQSMDQQVALDNLIKRTPALLKWIKDPNNTGLVVDDLATASNIERLIMVPIATWVRRDEKGELDVGPALGGPEAGFRAQPEITAVPEAVAAVGYFPTPGSLMAKIAAPLLKKWIGTPEENEKRLRYLETEVLPRWYGEESVPMVGWVEAWKMAPQIVGALGAGAVAAGGAALLGQAGPQAGVPEELFTVPRAFKTGAFAWTFLQERGGFYMDLREEARKSGQPIDDDIAWWSSGVVGAVNGALEVMSLGFMGKMLPAAVQRSIGLRVTRQMLQNRTIGRALRTFGKDYAKTAGVETFEEVAQEITSIAGYEAAKMLQGGQWDPFNPEAAVERLYETTWKTFSAMVFGGAFFGGPRLVSDLAQVGSTNRGAARLEALTDSARAAKFGERLPSSLRTLADQVAAQNGAKVRNVFVPVEDFNKVMSREGGDPAEAALAIFGDPKPYQEAMANGDDLVIPIGKYLEKVSRTDAHDKLARFARLDQSGLSLDQLKRAQADTEALIIEAVDREVTDYDPAEQVVFREVKQKVLDAGRDETEAEADAKITTHVLSRLAERSGRTLPSLYRRYQLSVRARAGEDVVEGLAQRSFHGTPHDIQGRFQLNRIGTGQGAATFGWGLYFAQALAVAKDYQAGFSVNGLFDPDGNLVRRWEDLDDAGDIAARYVRDEGSYEAARARVRREKAFPSSRIAMQLRMNATLDRIDEMERDSLMPGERGANLYAADLPELDELLHWDKLLSEQPPGVLEKLRAAARALSDEIGIDALAAANDGEDLYRALSQTQGGPRTASEYLRDLGIPGLAYLDQGSREEGGGTYNLVIWDEERIGEPLRLDQSAIAEPLTEQEQADLDYEPETTAAGKYKGTPEWVTTRAQLLQSRRINRSLLNEGVGGRYWYENCSAAVFELCGRNLALAEKFTQLLAIYSPNNAVPQNTQAAVKAMAHFVAGLPEEDLRAGLGDKKARAALYHDQHFAAALEGDKIPNFYKNLMHYFSQLMPEQVSELKLPESTKKSMTTVDLWMLRAHGYRRHVAKTGGRYDHIDRETRKLTAELNRDREPGSPKWLPHQVQAAIWTGIKSRFNIESVKEATKAESVKKGYSKYVTDENGSTVWQAPPANTDARVEHDWIWRKHALKADPREVEKASLVAAFSFAEALGDMTHIVPLEVESGTERLPEPLRSAQHEALVSVVVDEDGTDLVAKKVGFALNRIIDAWGGYVNKRNDTVDGVNLVSRIVVTKRESVFDRALLRTYAAIMQVIYQQDRVPWYRKHAAGATYARSVLSFPEALTPAQAGTLGDSIRAIDSSADVTIDGKDVRVVYRAAPGDTPSVVGFRKKLDALALELGGRQTKKGQVPMTVGVTVRFREPLTDDATHAFAGALRLATSRDMGYTRITPTEIDVANFTDLTDAQFRAGMERLVDEHEEAFGIDRASTGEFSSDGEYGPTLEEATVQVEALATERPELLAWVRDRTERAREIVRQYSSEADRAGREAELRTAAQVAAPVEFGQRDESEHPRPPPGQFFSSAEQYQHTVAAEQLAFDFDGSAPAVTAAVVAKPEPAGGIRKLFSRIRAEFVRQGYIDLRGRKLGSVHELAALGRIFRDPRFETFRIFWVKDGVIVANEAITSYRVGVTGMQADVAGPVEPHDQFKRHIVAMRARKERLGADGYYLMHNHPSGNPAPSNADLSATAWTARNLDGFLGHVVLDHERYGLVNVSDPAYPEVFSGDPGIVAPTGLEAELLTVKLDLDEPDPVLHDFAMRAPNRFFTQVKSSKDLTDLAQRIRKNYKGIPTNSALILYLDSHLFVRSAEEIPLRLLHVGGKPLRDHIAGRRRQEGAHFQMAYVQGDNPVLFQKLQNMIVQGLFVEAVFDMKSSGHRSARTALEKYGSVGHKEFPEGPIRSMRLYQSDDGRRGSIDIKGNRFDISLFEGRADRSTLLHELSHFFFEVLGDSAEEDGASAELQRDWQRALKWLGVGSRDELTVAHFEKWAGAFETYLLEGKPPTLDLSGTFARIRAWMMEVYDRVRAVVEIDDDIRGIFDRMLASEEEIRAARAELALQPIPELQRVMSQAAYSAYLETAREAVAAAEDEVRGRLMGDLKRETDAVYQEARDKVEAEVIEELQNDPVMRTLRYFETGKIAGYEEGLPAELLDANGQPAKLSKAILEAEYRKWVDALKPRASQVYRRTGGIHPALLANYLGLADDIDLLTILVETKESFRQAVEAGVQRKMESRYGRLLDERNRLAETALEASTGPQALDQLIIEIRALRKLVRPDERQQPAIDAALLRQRAEEQAGKQRIEELNPSRHLHAAQKHATAAAVARSKEKWDAVYDAKLRQMWAMALYRATRDTAAKVESTVSWLKRFGKAPAQQRLGKAGVEYLDRVVGLLQLYDLAYASTPELQRRDSLREWLGQKNALAEDIVIPDSVLNRATKVNYREISAAELFELRDAVHSIWNLAKLKTQLKTAKGMREQEDAANRLVAAAAANLPDRGPIPDDPELRRAQQRSVLSNIDARLLRPEGLVEMLDGGDRGPWHELIWDVISDASHAEADLAREYTLKLIETMKHLPQRKGLLKEQVRIKLLGQTYQRSAILAVALNTGNATNMQRLLEGRQWNENILGEILGHMSAEEWQWVQGVWDLLETLWPQISEMEQRLTGLVPAKVKRVGFTVTVEGKEVKLDGGYYPLIYDRDDPRGKRHEELNESMALLFEARAVRAMTPHGHVQNRVKTFTAPVLLSVDVIPRHLTQVIHDLTHREAILQTWRLLQRPDVFGAMTRYLGPEKRDQVVAWLKRQANPYQAVGDAWLERYISKARTNTAVVAMGGKVLLATQNFANIANAWEKVGMRYLAPACSEVWTSPFDTSKFIHSKSGEMRQRYKSIDREIRHALESGAQNDPRRFFFAMQQFTDAAISYPTWLGAYREGLAQGLDEGDAVRRADGVVRTTLGSGAPKDLAALQTGGELQRALTMFYGWFSVVYLRHRMLAHDVRKSGQEGRVIRDLPSFMARLLAWWIVPAILSQVLMLRGPDDDDDESWLAWLTTVTLFYPFQSYPLIREVQQFMETGRDPQFGSLTPILKTVGQVGEVAWDIVRGEFDPEEDAAKAAKVGTRAVGYALGLPASQFEITGGYLYDVWTGEEKPEDVIEFAHKLIARRKQKKERRR